MVMSRARARARARTRARARARWARCAGRARGWHVWRAVGRARTHRTLTCRPGSSSAAHTHLPPTFAHFLDEEPGHARSARTARARGAGAGRARPAMRTTCAPTPGPASAAPAHAHAPTPCRGAASSRSRIDPAGKTPKTTRPKFHVGRAHRFPFWKVKRRRDSPLFAKLSTRTTTR